MRCGRNAKFSYDVFILIDANAMISPYMRGEELPERFEGG